MTPLQAARSIALDRWADWGERERLVVNVANIYGELDGRAEPLNPLAAFQQMAELAGAQLQRRASTPGAEPREPLRSSDKKGGRR